MTIMIRMKKPACYRDFQNYQTEKTHEYKYLLQDGDPQVWESFES